MHIATRIVLVVILLLLLAAGGTFWLSWRARRPEHLGVRKGRLAPCPDSPNCVSTQATDSQHRMEPIPLAADQSDPRRVLDVIEKIIERTPRAHVVTRQESYLHAEFRSRVFRFVDDVEFLVDPAAQQLHFRSASRVGYSDFGANRDRMTKLRKILAAELSSEADTTPSPEQ